MSGFNNLVVTTLLLGAIAVAASWSDETSRLTPGRNHGSWKQTRNWPAYLEFGRRFRNSSLVAMCRHNEQLLQKPTPVEIQQYLDLVEDSRLQWSTQYCPPEFRQVREDTLLAHDLCRESAQWLYSAGSDRKFALYMAGRKCSQARNRAESAIKRFKALWNPTS